MRYRVEFDEDSFNTCDGCRGLGLNRKNEYMCGMARNDIKMDEYDVMRTRPIWCPLVVVDLGDESIKQRMRLIEAIKEISPATDKTLADIREIEDSIRKKLEIKHARKLELFNDYRGWIYD